MYNIHGWTIRQEQTHVAIHGITGEHKFAAYHATHILTGEGRLPIGGSERDSHAWRPGRPGCLPRAAPYPRTSHMQRTLQATNPRQEALWVVKLAARRQLQRACGAAVCTVPSAERAHDLSVLVRPSVGRARREVGDVCLGGHPLEPRVSIDDAPPDCEDRTA